MKYFRLLLISLLLSTVAFCQQSDSALRGVSGKDRNGRNSNGGLPTLSAAEHLQRGQTYFDNRQFPEAREHFKKIFDNYPNDPAMSTALFLTGRSYYWEREYAKAIPYLDRVAREYPQTKDGREGLNFKGACNVRLGNNDEAARVYEQYVLAYPTGERIESAHLNIIDALREAGRFDEANTWVDKARTRFAGTPTETNALQGRLRIYIYRGMWPEAEAAASLMLLQSKFGGSMTSADEVKYLRALALENAGKRAEAISVYRSIRPASYYGGIAAAKLTTEKSKSPQKGTNLVIGTGSSTARMEDFPAPFRTEVLQEASKRNLDPRFILAIMKQESAFRPDVKSPSAARGLLQLTIDTALKYNQKAGYPAIQPDDLYVPRTNIAIGCEYIAALRDEFGGLNEAIAASYNGGEDNAARWLNRSKPKEPGIFTAEIGFAETKSYVFNVMTNYRSYRELYDENLSLNRK
jgi:soluble lytic murein transglycosylase